MSQVEDLARFLASMDGDSPGRAAPDGPVWKRYEPDAQLVLEFLSKAKGALHPSWYAEPALLGATRSSVKFDRERYAQLVMRGSTHTIRTEAANECGRLGELLDRIDEALSKCPPSPAPSQEPVADFHERFGTTPVDAETPTPKPIAGRWWLIAPDGSDFQGDSPIECIKAEIASRVPARVALARIAEGLNQDRATQDAGANPTMTRDELVAAAESIGMRFPSQDAGEPALAPIIETWPEDAPVTSKIDAAIAALASHPKALPPQPELKP